MENDEAVLSPGAVGLGIGLAFGAGLCTTLGWVVVMFAKQANHQLLAAALGFSAGVMLFLSLVELLADEAVEEIGEVVQSDLDYLYALLAFFAGIVATVALDWCVHQLLRFDRHRRSKDSEAVDPASASATNASALAGAQGEPVHAGQPSTPRTSSDGNLEAGSSKATGIGADDIVLEPLRDSSEAVAAPEGTTAVPETRSADVLAWVRNPEGGEVIDKHRLTKVGVFTALAVGLHNLPEGLAVFFAAIASGKFGATLAFAIAIHNIPEGVAVALPVYYATGSRWRSFWWCMLSGMAEPVGALLGWLVLYVAGPSHLALGILFAMVAGMMTYISVQELLPTALSHDPKNRLVGWYFLLGMFVMGLSLALFRL